MMNVSTFMWKYKAQRTMFVLLTTRTARNSMSMKFSRWLPEAIEVPDRLRKHIREDAVASLMESIRAIGLRELPTVVTAQPTPWRKSTFVSMSYEARAMCRSQ
jgi:hypothetical protein